MKGETVTSITEEVVKNFRSKVIPETDFAMPVGYELVKHAPVPQH